MKKLLSYFHDPLFILGLLIRLLLIALILPMPVSQWYLPFLGNSVDNLSLDPWQSWLNNGGTPIAFPYGYAMWIFLMPCTLLSKWLSIPLAFGYGVSLIAADVGLLLILRKLFNPKDWALLVIYWLSPISLIASYALGYNDIIPVFLLMSSIYLLKNQRLYFSGIVLVAAISAKFSMVLSLPFFLIYLFNNRNLRQIFTQYITGLCLGLFIFFAPFLSSEAGLSMLISNPEVEKVYQLSINLVRNTAIYIVPLGYLLILYAAWRIRRMNFELFNAILGIAFLLVVLMTPASPGWFIWILPLLLAYQTSGDRASICITAIFSTLYVLSAALFLSTQQMGQLLQALGLQSGNYHSLSNAEFIGARLASLTHTGLVATGIILAIRIWRETIIRNDFFRLSRKPFAIGVSGDSGSGKDTFVDSIVGLFGAHSVTTISGDDYHLWDRHQPMWKVMTHINPAANDLESFAKNLVSLIDGKSIRVSHYDHDAGKMGRPFIAPSNDFIIASGLHALYLPILRECYDLSIFLDIDEGLRTYFKVQRDVNNRGYTIEEVLDTLERRKPDSTKFIKPQSAFSDLIFSLRPIHIDALTSTTEANPPALKLIVKSRRGFNELSLMRVLIGVCGLHVDMSTIQDLSEVELTIEGDTSAQDIEIAAKMICPQIFQFLDLKPKWQNGVLGLMQLITLSHINQALTRRLI